MSKPRTRHVQYTAEAFRELAEAALEELIDNTDTYEVRDLLTWSADLKRAVGRVSDHQTSTGPAPLGVYVEGSDEI